MSLVEIRIRDLAVFREATVPVAAGFVAITGETGAGKSLCITALRLALGGRVDGDPLSAGAGSAQVSAVFDDPPAAVRERLAGLGIAADELVTLTREVSRTGRGWCRINGALVSQAVLREAGEHLAEVTLQGASQRLLDRSRQRDVLDLAAGATELRAEVRAAVSRWREAEGRLAELRRRRAAGVAEVEEARALVEDLGPLAIEPGEDGRLAAERLLLRNAAALRAGAERLHRAVAGDEESPGAADLLAVAAETTAPVGGIDPDLDLVVDAALRLIEELRELGAAARRRAQSVATDEGRLAAIEDRLDALARVRRRHGSLEEALAALTAARDLLAARDAGGDAVGEAEGAVAASRAEAAELAVRLSERRRRAARRLEADVDAALHLLELPHARLRVRLERRPDDDGVEVDGVRVHCATTGIDSVELRLATNPDAEPVPLDQGPSGGELSRLVLALAACVAESGSPVLVLDEVDTGIGGETAARVGDLLKATGHSRQVLAVTHRAEIASRADGHLLVRKAETGRRSLAAIAPVEGDERLAEIARLMSGRVTGAALARAVELRGEAVATLPRAARRPR